MEKTTFLPQAHNDSFFAFMGTKTDLVFGIIIVAVLIVWGIRIILKEKKRKKHD